MQRIKTYAALFLLSVLTAGVVAVAPAQARPEVADAEQASTERRGQGQGRPAEVAAADAADIREKAKVKVTEERKTKTERTQEQRQKACEKRAANVNRKMINYTRHAEKHLATFDKIYDRVQDFKETKKLDAANYDELVAAADAKQAAAVAAVEALGEVSTEIDCTSEDPAAAVAAVKEAVLETRTALKDYRTAIKDVIKSLNASASKTADGGKEKTEGTTGDSTDAPADGATGGTTSGDNTTTDGGSAGGSTTNDGTEAN